MESPLPNGKFISNTLPESHQSSIPSSSSSINIQNYMYSYRRSAAGREIVSSTSLRSLDILEMCTHYLFHVVWYRGYENTNKRDNDLYNNDNNKNGLDNNDDYSSSSSSSSKKITFTSSPSNKGTNTVLPLTPSLSPSPSFRSPVRTMITTFSSSPFDNAAAETLTGSLIFRPLATYYYIMDRLRSIAADGRTQNFHGERWMRCIMSALRYHIFIDYILGSRQSYEKDTTNQSIESQKYETKFNDQRIMDYIATIVLLWESSPDKGVCSQFYTEALAYSFILQLSLPTSNATTGTVTTDTPPSSILATVLIRLRNHSVPIGSVLSTTIKLMSAWYGERYHNFLKLIDDLGEMVKDIPVSNQTLSFASPSSGTIDIRIEKEGLSILRYLVHRYVVTARSLLLLSRVKATPPTLKQKLSIEDILPWLRIQNESCTMMIKNNNNGGTTNDNHGTLTPFNDNTSIVPAWYAAAMLCLALEIPLEYTDPDSNATIVLKLPNELSSYYRKRTFSTDYLHQGTEVPSFTVQFHIPSERITQINDIGSIFTLLLHDHGKPNDTYTLSTLLQPYREDKRIALIPSNEWGNLVCLV